MPTRACPSCSSISDTEKDFCPECGASYTRADQPAIDASDPEGGPLATAGLACGIISFLFFPIVLGPIGIILGAIAWSKGHPRGKTATIVSIAGLVIGMILGAIMWSA